MDERHLSPSISHQFIEECGKKRFVGQLYGSFYMKASIWIYFFELILQRGTNKGSLTFSGFLV
jgi:hypothetical protein